MGIGKQRSTFISYSRHNKDFAVRLARELKASGFSVWLDMLDIPPGARWDDELESALERSEIFMVILTPASMASDNVKDEIGYAIDNRKRILPVLLESTTIPLRLRRFQYVDFSGKSFDEGVDAAKELLRVLIEAQTNPNLEIPPAFRSPDTEQAAHEDARRLAAQQAERLAELKAEEERTAKAEADRKAKEEAERLAKQKAEEERVAQARAEAERKAKAEQRAQAKAEKEKKAKEDAERLAMQKAEEERAAKAGAEAERVAAQKAEEDRLARAKAGEEADRLARAEAERRAKEDADRLAAQKAEQERIAQAKAESERKAKEEAERLASLKVVEERKEPQLEKKDSQSAVPAPALQPAATQGAPAKPKSRLPLIIGAVAVLGVCAVIGVIVLSNLGNRASVATEAPQAELVEQMSATEVPATEAPAERVATEAPIEEVAQVPVTGNLHVFMEMFDDNHNNWIEDENRFFQDGNYHMSVPESGAIQMATSSVAYTDFGPDVVVETFFAYSGDAAPGVYCRNQLNGNGEFYLFQVLDRSNYGIYYYDGSGWEEVTSGSMDLGGSDPYAIRAECIGNTLSFYVNNVGVATVTDDRLTVAGDLGLYIETNSSSGGSVEFWFLSAFAPFTTANCGTPSTQAIDIEIENQSSVDLAIFGSDSACNAYAIGYLPAGQTTTLYSAYVGDPYTFVDPQAGAVYLEYIAEEGVTYFVIE